MDETRKDADWKKSEAPVADSFGVTGMFDSVPDSVDAYSAPPPPSVAPPPVQEPVVHQVAMGSHAGEPPVNLLDILRNNQSPASDLHFSDPPPLPAPYSGAGASASNDAQRGAAAWQPSSSGDGFTQLIRSLGEDSLPPSPAGGFNAPQRPVPAFEPRPVEQNSPSASSSSGFTAILQQFGEPAKEAPVTIPASEPAWPREPVVQPISFPTSYSTVATPGSDEIKPAAAAPYAVDGKSAEPSFTQMISMINEPLPTPSWQVDAHPPYPPVSLSSASRAVDPLPPIQEAKGAYPGALPPGQPGIPVAGGAGLTQLLRALDGPSPAAPYSSGGGNVSVPPQTFEAPQGGFVTSLYGVPRDAGQGSVPSVPEPASPANAGWFVAQPPAAPSAPPVYGGARLPDPPLPPVSSGPGEVTRILEISKQREIQIQGNYAQGTSTPAAPPQAAAPPMFQAPPLPQPPQMQWPPQPPVAQPYQMPYAPPVAPQFPAAPAMPQVAMQPPSAPQAPAPTQGGKLQSYTPLLLILIAFLLLAILISLVFLMKH